MRAYYAPKTLPSFCVFGSQRRCRSLGTCNIIRRQKQVVLESLMTDTGSKLLTSISIWFWRLRSAFFSPRKKLCCSPLVRGMGEGSRVVKRMPVVAGRGSGRSQTPGDRHTGAPQRPLGSKGSWSRLRGYISKRHHPAQPGGPPACGGDSGVAHLLDEFHLPIQDLVLQEVTELRVCAGRAQGRQVQEGLGQAPLQDRGGCRVS